jgi:phosphatidylinositol-3,4,5-trisphosphate 3-phosphatase/dual-specificity protein phosphatase PTEN
LLLIRSCLSSLIRHHYCTIYPQAKMGSKLTKEGAVAAPGKIGSLTLQHQLINCLSNSFYIRNLVSKQRRRMLVAGYDLDMSYITDRILAMSFPSERMRAMYRNPLWQVKSVLDMRHPDHYKVFLFLLIT